MTDGERALVAMCKQEIIMYGQLVDAGPIHFLIEIIDEQEAKIASLKGEAKGNGKP